MNRDSASLMVATGPNVSVNIITGFPFMKASGMILDLVDKVMECKYLDCPCEDSYTESLCCDSAFAHKEEFYIFEFPERFLEISCAEISLLSSLFDFFNILTL